MIADLFAGTFAKVSAGIVAVLLAALVWCWLGWSNADAETEEAQRRLALSEAQHAVTRQSLATLEQEMAELVHAGELRAERLTDAMAQAKDDAAELRREADVIRRAGVRTDCVTDPSIMRSGL